MGRRAAELHRGTPQSVPTTGRRVVEDDYLYIVKWTDGQARAFQLLHIFLHELGHHHDRMTTRSERRAARGESYAELYANVYLRSIWSSYVREFGREL